MVLTDIGYEEAKPLNFEATNMIVEIKPGAWGYMDWNVRNIIALTSHGLERFQVVSVSPQYREPTRLLWPPTPFGDVVSAILRRKSEGVPCYSMLGEPTTSNLDEYRVFPLPGYVGTQGATPVFPLKGNVGTLGITPVIELFIHDGGTLVGIQEDDLQSALLSLEKVSLEDKLELDHVVSLGFNWDSEGGLPAARTAVIEAARLITQIHVISGRTASLTSLTAAVDGGIEMTWDGTLGRELFIIIPPDGQRLRYIFSIPKGYEGSGYTRGIVGVDKGIESLIRDLVA